jgi:EAL domain-containing protein (putative c-di-GMP-specific phosphodiesterase class I)
MSLAAVEEASTLAALGVEFGQGHLFGYPEAAAVWATTTTNDRSLGARERPS